MNAANWLKVIGIVIGLSPTLAGAALTVIYDSGDTQPIAPFLDAFESTDITAPQRPVIQPFNAQENRPICTQNN